MSKVVAILGTLDTKGAEFKYLKEKVEEFGCKTIVIDAGILDPPYFEPDIKRDEVAVAAGVDLNSLLEKRDRGESVTAMATGASIIVKRLYDEGKIDGIVSLGGSAGTSIATAAMKKLPAGFPKVMVSTLASGDTRPYVGTKDITMMYSIVDVSGLNRLSKQIIANAAGAICGMVNAKLQTENEKPVIGATMFGVTTPCVTRVREILEQNGYEVLVFHATGTGGQAMESLIEDGIITAVADITTTEWVDELCGGVLSAGPHRLEAAAKKGIPQVVCPGALDMCNFGPIDTVPESYKNRKLYKHNPTVTLIRTTPEESKKLGEIIGKKVSQAKGPTAVIIPKKGVSAIDAAGKPFYDPDADKALFEALKENVKPPVELIELDLHINDPEYAEFVANKLLELIKKWEGNK
ncbi:Uncharacterized protein, UPF0261 family [Caldanaerovirga acetigignens]|uniref:Uncharacterized protein, UPF0261 family n=1 Tax=Caldanaerovirga acetigignens TaxID=447595 RepID=A0A1M7IAB4_9FIRM|nr:Tm-1-like ATP-binding domain-containing protein [Caldanaerovirga acetigignens]SHM37756.1 Uncharacterized protein, UPF0261 family [Caldanaerovirga acetigignens]